MRRARALTLLAVVAMLVARDRILTYIDPYWEA